LEDKKLNQQNVIYKIEIKYVLNPEQSSYVKTFKNKICNIAMLKTFATQEEKEILPNRPLFTCQKIIPFLQYTLEFYEDFVKFKGATVNYRDIDTLRKIAPIELTHLLTSTNSEIGGGEA
jgi:hypothetical protein